MITTQAGGPNTNHVNTNRVTSRSQRLRKNNQIKSAKIPLKVATWNVRTLNSPTKLDELTSTARDYKIDALAVTETLPQDAFDSKVNGYTFFNSGERSLKRNGAGLLLSPQLALLTTLYR